MNVTLREKKLKTGRSSLYLDFYPPIIVDGKKTRREFLKLYTYGKPKSEIERDHNKETKLLAQNICAKRQLDLQANPHGFVSSRKRKGDFLTFFLEIVNRRKSISESSFAVWKNIYYYFSDYCGGACTFAQIDREFLEKFRAYLLICRTYKAKHNKKNPDKDRKLSKNTAKEYFIKFGSVIGEAFGKRYLFENPILGIDSISGTTPKREFLLLEELKVLAQTSCNIPDNLRRAALFSSLSGLRHSDIRNLYWKNVRQSRNGFFLDFQIKKTEENSLLPISEEARDLLGEYGTPDEKVFPDLKYDTMTNVYVERWTKAAGIERRITFHAFRHTYATAQISEGTDLYTVQKMLGHRNIKQTEIYARLLDEKKRAAANKITLK